MQFSRLAVSALAVSHASAVTLWVSSYFGGVTTLDLKKTGSGYSLKQTAYFNGTDGGCGADPSWLTLDSHNDVLYCVDEGWGQANGTVYAYKPKRDGSLNLINTTVTIDSPVSTIVYNEGKALAAAHYDTSSVTTYSILPSGALKELQHFTYTLAAPGAVPARQAAPHEHEVILDPTGSFIVVPDLGADLIRIFAIDKTTSLISESSTHAVPPGTGPRHGTFLKTHHATYLFIIAELANDITSFSVEYTSTGLTLTQVFVSGAYGVGVPIPTGAGAAEAILSPDHRFLLTSERHVASFQIPNYDPNNSTTIPSDALIVWTIDHETGTLCNAVRSPAGGMNPRQFSVNKAGTLAAVGLQDDSRVVIIERDVEDGTFGAIVAHVDVAGDPSSVIWDE